MPYEIVFLGFVVGAEGTAVDQREDQGYQRVVETYECKSSSEFSRTSKLLSQVRKGFPYRRCTTNQCYKKGCWIRWGEKRARPFQTLIEKPRSAPMRALPDFHKIFDIECDASGIGIGAVLMQDERPIAFFSEESIGATLNCSTYDKELYICFERLATLIAFERIHRTY